MEDKKFKPIELLGVDYIESIKTVVPNQYELLKLQDEQIKKINEAEKEYFYDNDIDKLIKFWEELHRNGGLLFNGVRWVFRLAELYYENGDFDKLLNTLESLKGYKDKYNEFMKLIK